MAVTVMPPAVMMISIVTAVGFRCPRYEANPGADSGPGSGASSPTGYCADDRSNGAAF
jgi:hypothetical protein